MSIRCVTDWNYWTYTTPISDLLNFASVFIKYKHKILNPIFWKCINFEDNYKFDNKDIYIVLHHIGKQLTNLKFSKHYKINSNDFLKIISSNSNIENLECPQITCVT